MTRFIARSAVAAGLAAMALCISASASPRLPARSSPDPGQQNILVSVRTLTATDAWAVGSYCKGACLTQAPERTLVLHWNGTKWVQTPSPNPSFDDTLASVSGSSPTDVWAVGQTVPLTGNLGPLVLRWSGRKWVSARFNAFAATRNITLTAVSARSARDAWIVGFESPAGGGPATAVTARWNGRAWRAVPVPRLKSSFLFDVSASSARNAWAVGISCAARCGRPGEVDQGVMLHWNGRKWSSTQVPVKSTEIQHIVALSATDAWATGNFQTAHSFVTVILHWNGKRWSSVRGVPGVSPQALAFGAKNDGWGTDGFESMRWNGVRWRRVTIPGPLTSIFAGASAAGPSDVWAVGYACPLGHCSGPSETIATVTMHWNGRSWTRK